MFNKLILPSKKLNIKFQTQRFCPNSTLKSSPVEKAEQRKKEAKQAKQQLINEDDMSDPLQSASFKRFSKLLDIIFEHEDEMVPENFKLSMYQYNVYIIEYIMYCLMYT